MRGLFCRLLLLSYPLLGVIGCSDDPGSGRLNTYKGPPSPDQIAPAPATVTNESVDTVPPPTVISVIGFTRDPGPPEIPSKTDKIHAFGDYAAYVFADPSGQEWLSQTLLDMDGSTFNQRYCPIDLARGTVWDQCDDWQVGIQIGSLDIGLRYISGLGSFVFRDDANTQLLMQSAFTVNGDEHFGRVCPIDKRPSFEACTAWEKFGGHSADIGIDGVSLFRGDETYVFKNRAGASVFAQRVLSADGSQAWQRSCASPGTLFAQSKACAWSPPVAINTLNIYGATALSGWGAHVYSNQGFQVFTETVISEDGTKSARRECLFDNQAIDPHTCTPWSYRLLTNVLTVNRTIL